MKFFEEIVDQIKAHPALAAGLFGLSIVAFFATIIVVPTLLVRMDENYFVNEKTPSSRFPGVHPLLRALILAGKNLLAVLLVLIGILLLFLPGQGLLTIVLGVLLLDFPGRYKLKRSLLSRPKILRMVNQLRERYGRAPIRFE